MAKWRVKKNFCNGETPPSGKLDRLNPGQWKIGEEYTGSQVAQLKKLDLIEPLLEAAPELEDAEAPALDATEAAQLPVGEAASTGDTPLDDLTDGEAPEATQEAQDDAQEEQAEESPAPKTPKPKGKKGQRK